MDTGPRAVAAGPGLTASALGLTSVGVGFRGALPVVTGERRVKRRAQAFSRECPPPAPWPAGGALGSRPSPAGAGACAHVELPVGFTQAQEWGRVGFLRKEKRTRLRPATDTSGGRPDVKGAPRRAPGRAAAAGFPRASRHLSTCARCWPSSWRAGAGVRGAGRQPPAAAPAAPGLDPDGAGPPPPHRLSLWGQSRRDLQAPPGPRGRSPPQRPVRPSGGRTSPVPGGAAASRCPSA